MRILINGAGIDGAALAILLQRQGHAILLTERQPAGASQGYVLGLWPEGSRVLHALGL